MPDWIVLISTFGGMALFGINGFVIGPLIMALFMASWGIVARGEQAQAEANANAAGAANAPAQTGAAGSGAAGSGAAK